MNRRAFLLMLALCAIGLSAWGQDAVVGSPAADPSAESTHRRGQAYVHLVRARLYAGEGRVYKVVRELREATQLQPASAELHAQSATLLLRLGQVTEARRMADRALELDAGTRDAVRVLADLAAREASRNPASRARAVELYERLAEAPQVEDEVLLILAQLKQAAGDRPGAIAAAERLVAQRPGDSVSLRMLAQSLMLDSQDARALFVMLDHLQRNPRSEDLYPMVEELAYKADSWAPLVAVFDEVVRAVPESASAHRILGQALLAAGRPAQAVPELERAVELEPEDPSTQLRLANAYRRAKRLADASELAARLSREYPGAIESRWLLAEALVDRSDVEGALEAFQSALDVGGTLETDDRDRIRIRMAGLLLDENEVERAKEVLRQLEEPEHIASLQIQAQVAIRVGDLGSTRALARRLREGGRPGVADLVEGELYLEQGHSRAATERFRAAIAELGRDGRLWVDRLLQQRDETELAEEFLRDWIAAEPDSADARFALGSLLDRRGHHEIAEVELRRVLEMDPDHAWALNHLGYSLADRNRRLDEALALIRRALELDPWNGAYLDSLGWVYFRLRRFEEALAPLQEAAREYPRDPVVMDHLGDVYSSLGRNEQAIAAWTQALQLGPEDAPSIEAKLAAARGLDEAQATDTALKNRP